LVLLLTPALLLVPGNASARTRSPTVSAAVTRAPSAPLTLLAQTPWVSKGRHFALWLETGTGTPPTAQLGVSIDVYPCLSSISGFDQSVAAPPSGTPISSTGAPLPISGLPPVAGGGFDLSLPVKVDDAQASAPGGFTIDLASVADQCGLYPAGVYPVRVELVDMASGQAVGGITTHLIYTDAPANTQKLRFALVLPIRTAIVAAPAPKPSQLQARPGAALADPSAAATGALVGTVDAVARNPTVALTLVASPQAVDALQSAGHQATVNQLSALAATPNVHQFASTTFVPVNASGLVAAGLSAELAMQISRGTSAISTRVTHLATTPGHLGTWISDKGLDTATLDQLQSAGYSRVILPSGSVTSPPTNGSTARPFVLATSSGAPMTAFASNLSARFTGPAGNPVLAAHQLVAELAQIYYEQPNDDTARAVVGVPPSSWSDDPAFVNALLTALAGNPIIQPLTTSELFDSFPTATTCRNACRLQSGTGSAGLPANAIRIQRQRINSFSIAAPTARSLGAALGDLVLAGESDLLRPPQQAAVLHNTRSALNAQLAQLEVASGQSLTLTSQQGRLPIDIVSSAPYPVRATLTVTSDKLLFANGTTGLTESTTVLPGHSHTNVVYVNVRARTSGVFTVGITLDSPVGGLQLSSGQIVVRSTATSIVGIVLSLGAVVVLVVWWVRTSRKRRSVRLAEEEPTGNDPRRDVR
jgi:hypothetical protein